MSTIYGALYKKLDKQRYSDEPMNPVAVELGLAWERALEKALIVQPTFEGEHIERPGELLTEPMGVSGVRVAYNPDLLVWSPERVRVGEIKLKWMSSRDAPREDYITRFPEKYAKDFTQMKAYCYHCGTRFARYYVFYINGDYARQPGEIWTPNRGCYGPHEPYVWDIEFEQWELDEEWAVLLNFATEEGML